MGGRGIWTERGSIVGNRFSYVCMAIEGMNRLMTHEARQRQRRDTFISLSVSGLPRRFGFCAYCILTIPSCPLLPPPLPLLRILCVGRTVRNPRRRVCSLFVRSMILLRVEGAKNDAKRKESAAAAGRLSLGFTRVATKLLPLPSGILILPAFPPASLILALITGEDDEEILLLFLLLPLLTSLSLHCSALRSRSPSVAILFV